MNARGGPQPIPMFPRGGLPGDEEASQRAAPFGLDDFITIIRKRLWLLLATTVVCFSIAVLALSTYPPQYVASTDMLLGTQSGATRNSSDLLEDRALTDTAIQGELAILGSSALLIRVVHALELDKDPEFNAALRPPPEPVPVIDPIKNALQAAVDFIKVLLLPPPAPEQDAEEVSEGLAEASTARDAMLGEYSGVANSLRRSLSFRQRGSSFVVEVTATSENPIKAAGIANAVADEYIDFVSDRRFEAAQRFTRWLETRVGELADVLEVSETAVISYEAVADSQIDSPERLNQQMQEVTSRLVDTRSRLAEVEAQGSKAQALLADGNLIAAATILTSPAMDNYVVRLAALRADTALALERFADDSARVMAIKRETMALTDALQDEVDRAVQGLLNQAEVLRLNVTALRENLDGLENTMLARSKHQIKLNQLVRVADANRRLYNDFLSRFKESSEIQNLRQADAEVIAYGSPPNAPALPRKKATVVLAIFGGLFLGMSMIFLLELLPKSFVTSDQVTRALGLRVFGHLPRLPIKDTARNLATRLSDRAGWVLGGAARSAIRNLDLTLGRPARSAMLVSLSDDKERSTLAMLLAWAAAQQGKKCLLLDADLRTAGLTKRFEVNPSAGFVEVLYEEAPLKDAIIEDTPLGVSLLPMIPGRTDAATLFGTARADRLIKDLCERFDLLLIDAPGLLEVSDLVSLPSPIDMGLLAVCSKRTRVKTAKEGYPLFRSLNFTMEGAVLTGLRMRG